MSSGSEGLYLSLMSDMSPATSDCLETYVSGGFILFSNYRVCVDFSGSFYFFLIYVYPFWVVSLRPRKASASVGPVRMLESTE